VRIRRAAWIVTTAVLVSACSNGGTASPSVTLAGAPSSDASVVSLTVYGAASLKAVLAEVKTVYEAATPRISLTISTDSSAALEAKIEDGAPVDVFLSADTSNPQKLADKGMAAGDPTPFAGNLLTVIVPAANAAGIRAPADLGREGVKVIAAGDAVPITKYASRLVANLAAQPGYPADFVARYDANVVSKEDNAAAVVAKVALGEGDAGIVYRTDARASSAVRTIAVPDAANVPATYAGVVVKASANPDAARAFLAWLASPAGQAVLAGFGFLPPS
jgi:molybdate transport system substrate-binding protein